MSPMIQTTDDLRKITREELQQGSDALVEAIAPMLEGKNPSVVSLTFAELTAMMLSGYRPALRMLTAIEPVRTIDELGNEKFVSETRKGQPQ